MVVSEKWHENSRVRAVEMPRELIMTCLNSQAAPPLLTELAGKSPPRRWGRMDGSSRLAIASVAHLITKKSVDYKGKRAGFVAAGRYGCLATDLAYARTLAGGQPSPLLFSYTLPNIAPSEAASFFGFTGPVYGVVDGSDPLKAVMSEADMLLSMPSGPDIVFFAVIETFPIESPYAAADVIEKGASRQGTGNSIIQGVTSSP